METVSDPQLSPDGSKIIYTRGWVDKMNDRRESALWIMNADGSRNRFLVKGSGARWSPTGDRIAYTAQGEPRGSQVFVRWMDAEGATSQVTRVDQAPSAIAWSPDGTQLSFTALVEERNNWPIKLPKAPAGAKWTEQPRIVERLNYRRDRTGFIDSGFRHIFVVPAIGGTPRQITNGNFDHAGSDWTPDGKSILFSGLRVASDDYQWRESEIYAVDVVDGNIRQLTSRKGPDGNPSISPDGKRVAYTGNDFSRDTWVDSKIYLMNIDGSNPRLVSGDWDRSPAEMRWAADGSGVYFTAQSEGSQNLYFLPLGSTPGKVTPVTKGVHMLGVSDISPKGAVVGTLTSFKKPGDIISFDVKNPATIKQLTAVNEDVLAGKKIGDVNEIWYTSVDGMKIQGWYITPPDFNPTRKYPMQLHIHGGPHGMYGVGFNFGWQEHAANDYVVLYTNPRGSTGYGSAFGNAIKNAYPSKDYDDLMAGVDALLAKGFVDPQNMFVTGCSGGGVLTAWIVGHTDRFRRRVGELPGHRLAVVCRDDRRCELVLQLRKAAVGGPDRTHPPFAADVRRECEDTDDADDGCQRSADADAADRAVLQRAQAAQGPDRNAAVQRRVARHDQQSVELHANAAVSALLVRQVQAWLVRTTDDHQSQEERYAPAAGTTNTTARRTRIQ